MFHVGQKVELVAEVRAYNVHDGREEGCPKKKLLSPAVIQGIGRLTGADLPADVRLLTAEMIRNLEGVAAKNMVRYLVVDRLGAEAWSREEDLRPLHGQAVLWEEPF